MAQIDYVIAVDTSNNASVTPDQNSGITLHLNDLVTFRATKPTRVKYTTTSPFATLPPGTLLTVKSSKTRTFKITKAPPNGTVVHHFDCLHLVNKTLVPWGGGGNGTPV